MYNVVDDKEMSPQGSVNALVAPQHSTTPEQMTMQAPTEIVGIPVASSLVGTQLSRVARYSSESGQKVPVESTQVIMTPTVVVDAPSLAETKQAFDEVLPVLQSISTQQTTAQAAMSS